MFRGSVGRKFFRGLQTNKLNERRDEFFNYHVTIIQRTFRGFYSRKTKHNHAERKRYLQMVVEKGEEQRVAMKKYKEDLIEYERCESEKRGEEEFTHLTQNLHHLVSTKNTPGIFSAPDHPSTSQRIATIRSQSRKYSSSTGGLGNTTTTVMGKPVEGHINDAVRELLRSNKYTKKTLKTDLSGTKRKVPIQPSSRLSLQASVPYELPEIEERRGRRVGRLNMLGGSSMLVGKAPIPPHEQNITSMEPYEDAFRNPYLIRGVPKNQAELAMDRTSLGKFPEIPYYTSVGGNKSSVLPNDRFDVMLEAEQSGGVTLRNLGQGERFGLADTCDIPRMPAPPS